MVRSPEVVVGPLQLVLDLCDALDRDGIRTCHWKSTDALDRSASGENDLDLLVAEDDVARFEAVLHTLGFVEAIVGRAKRQPGIRHFYGLDDASGRLVDVHAHERLILGDDATKNYRLPIETAYLSTSTAADPFMVPDPELELAVFVVRMMLKHGSPEAIVSGRGSLGRREREELASLEDRSDPAVRWHDLARSVPMLDRQLLERCIASFDPGRTLRMRLKAWGELRRRLAPGARRPRAVDVWLQGWRRIAGRTRRHLLGRPPRKRPATGGRVIALIGSDGSGKSTTARGLAAWLSPVFTVRRVHMGKPRRSLAWILLRSGIHLGRRLGVAGTEAPAPVGSPDAPVGEPGRARQAIEALTARDRWRAATRARRLAARGSLVICDRYPLPEISVDGPRPPRRDADPRAAPRRLVEIEHRYHARIAQPDIVVVLAVAPEVAIRRRPEADPAVIDARAREVLGAPWAADVAIVDASQSVEAVLADVKRAVWSRL